MFQPAAGLPADGAATEMKHFLYSARERACEVAAITNQPTGRFSRVGDSQNTEAPETAEELIYDVVRLFGEKQLYSQSGVELSEF
jgi:hypothetical protein